MTLLNKFKVVNLQKMKGINVLKAVHDDKGKFIKALDVEFVTNAQGKEKGNRHTIKIHVELKNIFNKFNSYSLILQLELLQLTLSLLILRQKQRL